MQTTARDYFQIKYFKAQREYFLARECKFPGCQDFRNELKFRDFKKNC